MPGLNIFNLLSPFLFLLSPLLLHGGDGGDGTPPHLPPSPLPVPPLKSLYISLLFFLHIFGTGSTELFLFGTGQETRDWEDRKKAAACIICCLLPLLPPACCCAVSCYVLAVPWPPSHMPCLLPPCLPSLPLPCFSPCATPPVFVPVPCPAICAEATCHAAPCPSSNIPTLSGCLPRHPAAAPIIPNTICLQHDCVCALHAPTCLLPASWHHHLCPFHLQAPFMTPYPRQCA